MSVLTVMAEPKYEATYVINSWVTRGVGKRETTVVPSDSAGRPLADADFDRIASGGWRLLRVDEA